MMKQILFLLIVTFTVVFSVDLNEPCDTPLDELGHITLLRDCPSLFEKTKNKPILREDEKLIYDSVQLRDGRKVYVCCPLEAANKDQTEAATEPAKKWKENDICRTPDNRQGSCQKLKSCKPLHKKYEEDPENENLIEFIQASLCFRERKALYICCSDDDMKPEPETTTQVLVSTTEDTIKEETGPVWLRELRKKVPKAPECGFDVQDRIFGGEVADITDFPWTALLEYRKPGNEVGFNCGGSLINNRYVLTAAHCVDSIPDGWKLENVVLGEWDVLTEYDCDRHGTCSDAVVVKKVVKTIVHERYRAGANNKHDDIALLRLASEVDFNDFVLPICLPLDASQWKKNYSGDRLYAAGWGRTENNKVSTKKLKVVLPFRTFNECNRQYRKLGIALKDQHHICAGIEEKDTCKGDSGGSLMYYDIDRTVPFWYAVGVVSFGGDACGQGLPGVYTKVENYLEWINKNIE